MFRKRSKYGRFMLMRSDVEIKGKDWPAALKTLEAAY